MNCRIPRAIISSVIFTAVVFAVIFIGFWFTGSRSDLQYRSVDYDVTVQTNGDITVTQHIDMKLGRRSKGKPWKQLYQQYTLNQSDLADITDISVKNVTTGETYTRTTTVLPSDVASDAEWNNKYAGHWYAQISDLLGANPKEYKPGINGMPIYSDETQYDDFIQGNALKRQRTVEIGWNIPATKHARSMKFDVTMTLVGAARLHPDIAWFQWEPIAESNTTPIGRVTGTVHFPKGITAKNSWAWLHYAGSSSTSRDADGTLHFQATNVAAGRYLNLLAAFDSSVVHDTSNGMVGAKYQPAGEWIRTRDYPGLQSLKKLESEKLAKAQAKQRKTVRTWAIVLGLELLLCAISLGTAIFGRWRAHGPLHSKRVAYRREVPSLKPATVAKIADILGIAKSDNVEHRRLAAMMLSLVSKGVIALYPGPARLYGTDEASIPGSMTLTPHVALQALETGGSSGGVRSVTEKEMNSTSTIVLHPVRRSQRKPKPLTKPEHALLRILEFVGKDRGADTFDLNQMQKSCQGWRGGYKALERFTDACNEELGKHRIVRPIGGMTAFFGLGTVLYGVTAAVIYMGLGNLALSLIMGAPGMLLGSFAFLIAPKEMFTKNGAKYGEEVAGFYRYLTDFSDFTDRGALDLALWDEYLIYATAMGISRQALNELAKAYPQVKDPEWLDSNASDSLMYWDYRSISLFGASNVSSGLDSSGFASGIASNYGGITDLGSQLSSGFSEISSTIHAAAPVDASGSGSGGFSGGGFDGGGGGAGGGSFGGR
ncbi:hypothetical protein BISA_1111 [Bifidobacterium saguini DSM 23967]|uniref:DUF2207 domain-containing protein n=2 Tax=Bifidobacterium saguini TaxID=762210 RepID=A0A087D8H3_9BIFI|nr:DUF2207 domain-containing protein [Bifidobacterium saguini]KFI91823.1 hypothetical protein BISA_1111 [Bifidobacterium saguini DSM 23967]QTB90163.1 DUF2207 domain-containing protein [Bifidobacterium saguini]